MSVDVSEIKAYIESSGFKQKAVADKSGLDEYKLCMSLQGKRKLEAGEYASICSALGVPMTMFVKPRLSVQRGGENVLEDIQKITIETDEENPITIAEINSEEIKTVDGYRVRLTPKYD